MIRNIKLTGTDGKKFDANEAHGIGWRLIHDGTKVIDLIEGTLENVTTTKYIIEEFPTKEDALAAINTPRVRQEAFKLKYKDK
jgi:hypothetical protein